MDFKSFSNETFCSQAEQLTQEELSTLKPLRRSLRLSQRANDNDSNIISSGKEKFSDNNYPNGSIQTVFVKSDDILKDCLTQFHIPLNQGGPEQQQMDHLEPFNHTEYQKSLNLSTTSYPNIKGKLSQKEVNSGNALEKDSRVVRSNKIIITSNVPETRARPRNNRALPKKPPRTTLKRKCTQTKHTTIKSAKMSTCPEDTASYHSKENICIMPIKTKNLYDYKEKLRNLKTSSNPYNTRKQRSLNDSRFVAGLSSILPDKYPSHFTYQLPPENIVNDSTISEQQLQAQLVQFPVIYETPEYKSSSTSTSPSLPESLRGAFYTDDIHELLQVERVAYRLYDHHVRALAIVLNVDLNYLREVLSKVLKLSFNILEKVDNIKKSQFIKDGDLFPNNTPSSPEMIISSPNSHSQRIFPSQRKQLNITT